MEITEQIIKVVRSMNIHFSLNGRPMMNEEVFSATGLLPGMAKRADQLCMLCLGYGIGASFEEAEGSILGVKVVFDDITLNVLRLLCIVDVINELSLSSPRGGLVPLDQLMYD